LDGCLDFAYEGRSLQDDSPAVLAGEMFVSDLNGNGVDDLSSGNGVLA
jgi:hypothetical protein